MGVTPGCGGRKMSGCGWGSVSADEKGRAPEDSVGEGCVTDEAVTASLQHVQLPGRVTDLAGGRQGSSLVHEGIALPDRDEHRR